MCVTICNHRVSSHNLTQHRYNFIVCVCMLCQKQIHKMQERTYFCHMTSIVDIDTSFDNTFDAKGIYSKTLKLILIKPHGS
jgi:hypothetical protein